MNLAVTLLHLLFDGFKENLFVRCRTNDLREKLNNAQEELRQLDMDIEESQGSRHFYFMFTT